jgi:hypothetical protein
MELDGDKLVLVSVVLVPVQLNPDNDNDDVVHRVFTHGRDGEDPELLGLVEWDRGGPLSESSSDCMRQFFFLVRFFFELLLFSTAIFFCFLIAGVFFLCFVLNFKSESVFLFYFAALGQESVCCRRQVAVLCPLYSNR